eukprot:14031962-Ditylum_brightwellii.AAC.1
MNPNWREHQAKYMKLFTIPQQLHNGNTGSHNAVNNQEQTDIPPRWKKELCSKSIQEHLNTNLMVVPK